MTKKKRIPEMMPIKKWLSTDEACAYMNLSHSKFITLSLTQHLTVTTIGITKYFKVSELDQIFENNISIKQIA